MTQNNSLSVGKRFVVTLFYTKLLRVVEKIEMCICSKDILVKDNISYAYFYKQGFTCKCSGSERGTSLNCSVRVREHLRSGSSLDLLPH